MRGFTAPRTVAAALVAVVLAVAGCSSSGSPKPKASDLNPNQGNTSTYDGFGLIPPQPRPSFTLTDTQGKTYAFGQKTRGKTTLLYFGYTNCPDICPETMADIGLAIKKLPVAQQKKITVVFASTDPKHDTGPVISEWLHNFSAGTHATWVGLHGDQQQTDTAQLASHLPFTAGDGGQNHSTEVLLFSPDDYAHVDYSFDDKTEESSIAHDLPIAMSKTR